MIIEAIVNIILNVLGLLFLGFTTIVPVVPGVNFSLPQILFDFVGYVLEYFALAFTPMLAWWVWRQIKS